MARVDEFDAFYHASRRPLLHQTYALTGDVGRAAEAVEDAFAHAWTHWRKVRRVFDPVAWVRTEAWRLAAGPRPRWRRRRVDPGGFVGDPRHSPHRRDLEMLRALPDHVRRVVVLHHLAELPVERVAHEVGTTASAAASMLARGEQVWTDDGRTSVAAALRLLEDDVAGVRLTRGVGLRRTGERKHRQQSLVGMVTALALLVSGGLLIGTDGLATMGASTSPTPSATPSPRPAAPTQAPFLLDRGALLTAADLRPVTRPTQAWTAASTTDGTTRDPLAVPCQRAPFADPDGRQSLVRHFGTDTDDVTAVQVIEESRSELQSRQAFEQMERWYSRCADDGVQLVDTFAVRDLGDRARAFRLRVIGSPDTEVTVGVMRTGPITVALAVSARDGTAVPVQRLLQRAAVTVTQVCLPVSGDCSSRPEVRPTAPLPAGVHDGFLASYDLPKVGGVAGPWVGTDPRRTRGNPGATSCERAEFRRSTRPRSRVFVLPTASRVPRRFGVTETVAGFRSRAAAQRFLQRAYASVRGCQDRDLSAARPRAWELPGHRPGRTWRFRFEVDERTTVTYRVGLVRAGSRVALVSMSPSGAYDVTPRAFNQLVERAGHRLTEAAAGA
jgi:RNA polymerase sigma-70 factor, ECF subfamily